MLKQELFQIEEQLQQYRLSKALQDELIVELQSFSALAASAPDHTPTHTNNTSRPTEDRAATLHKLKSNAYLQLEKTAAAMEECYYLIEQAGDSKLCDLLFLVYIKFLPWTDCAKHFGVTVHSIAAWHTKALKNIYNSIYSDL